MYRLETTVEIKRNQPLTIVAPDRISGKRPVLFLHGMGESGQSILDQHEELIVKSGRTWILPNGPLPFERRRLSRIGYSWYLFLGDQQILRASMGEAITYLKEVIIAAQAAVHLEMPVTCLGFSQGGYLGSVAAATEPTLFASMGCLGGRLKHEFFPRLKSYPPMLQLHGEDDKSVSKELAEGAIASAGALGVTASMLSFANTGHEITAEMLTAFLAWEEQIA